MADNRGDHAGHRSGSGQSRPSASLGLAPGAGRPARPHARSSAAATRHAATEMLPFATPSISIAVAPFPSVAVAEHPPLHLMVRFLSLADMPVDIDKPHQTTVGMLKSIIRGKLMRREEDAKKEATEAAMAKAARAGEDDVDSEDCDDSKDSKADSEDEREDENEDGKKDKKTARQPARQTKHAVKASAEAEDAVPPALRDAHRRRLRLLHSGKILADDAVLSRVLRPLPPLPTPPRARASSSPRPGAAAGAGASALRSLGPLGPLGPGLPLLSLPPASPSPGPTHRSTPDVARVYISCNMDDILPDKEIMTELLAGADTPPLLSRADGATEEDGSSGGGEEGEAARFLGRQPGRVAWLPGTTRPAPAGRGAQGALQSTSPFVRAGGDSGDGGSNTGDAPSTTTAPRGFDRLLGPGFSAAEVNQLRLQFRSIQATRFTPDAMPSPDTLRAMEEQWLESGSGGGGGGGSGDGTARATMGEDGAPLPEDDFAMPGLLEVMVRAMLMGFVWPLGTVGWLAREPGLWTRKWQVFASFGVLLSLLIGSIKTLAGEW